jgi:hypothetical protein
MAAMRAADRCDVLRMARSSEPIMNRRPDAATLDGLIAWSMMPGDQEDHAFATGDGLFEETVDR